MTNPTGHELYLQAALSQIPRLLSLQDRNPLSKTYGCFDRPYWLHRTKDFPGAIHQMGAHSLALVWGHALKDNPYYQNPNILSWCLAGIRYGLKLQHQDGSFDEWYPNERGWAGPTGYWAHAMAGCYFILKEAIDEDLRKDLQTAIHRAALFLIRSGEEFVLANHHAIALLPIYEAYLITYDEVLLKGFKDKLEEFRKYCYDEGWSLEYDGADIGYLSGTISFLSRLYRLFPDKEIKSIVEKAVEFTSYFFYPDGFFGGSMGSRQTGHFYHFGYEAFGKQLPLAAAMAQEALGSLTANKLVPPAHQEDHYMIYRIPEYIEAYLVSDGSRENTNLPALPYQRQDFVKIFKHAGIFIQKKGNIYSVINLARGGVIKIFNCTTRQLLLNDSGWVAQLGHKKVVTSQWNDARYRICLEAPNLSVQGQAQYVVMKNFTPLTMILFRLFMLLFGWHASLAYAIKAGVRKNLMVGAKPSPVHFCRKVVFENDGVKIQDTFKLKGLVRVESILIGGEIPTRYVPQSRYFQFFELNINGHFVSLQEIASLNQSKELCLTQTINLSV